MQLKHETSTSTLGSVNGKKCGRSTDLALVAEDRPREREQRPLQIAERDVGVDGEPFDLGNWGRVGGVVVGPVYPPGITM